MNRVQLWSLATRANAKVIMLIVGFVAVAATGPANAGLVSLDAFPDYNRNSAIAFDYTQDGQNDPNATGFTGYWGVYALDGVDHTATASAAGSQATLTRNDGSPDANTVIFATHFNFVRAAGAAFGNVTHAVASTSFVATEDLTYTIAGSFTNTGGWTEFDVRLADRTDQVLHGPFAPDPLGPFLSRQRSSDPTGASFTIGLSDFFDGPHTGTLLQGHYYQFTTDSSSYFGSADNGGNAFGEVTLTLTGPLTAVPEPSTLLIAALGVFCTIPAWRR